tara:strand:- start:3954 stop:4469 length:516 start_codon:yes stop_codon:yes gene_type:complete
MNDLTKAKIDNSSHEATINVPDHDTAVALAVGFRNPSIGLHCEYVYDYTTDQSAIRLVVNGKNLSVKEIKNYAGCEGWSELRIATQKFDLKISVGERGFDLNHPERSVLTAELRDASGDAVEYTFLKVGETPDGRDIIIHGVDRLAVTFMAEASFKRPTDVVKLYADAIAL